MSSLFEHGERKFPQAGLLASSRDRGWSNFAAELRAHPTGEIDPICPEQMEITLAVSGNAAAYVERRGNGRFQSTCARSGTLWFCPIGIREDAIRITGPIPQVLHLYVPKAHFLAVAEMSSRPISLDERSYLAGVEDSFVREIGYRVLRELQAESAAGSLLMEQASMCLATHLAGGYSENGRPVERADRSHGRLDARRLRRVLDYIEAHLEDDLSIGGLAAVACLSRHHFARAFKASLGEAPHVYIAARRLEHARNLLTGSSLTLAEVALACRFSSQATFTRAFQREVGLSPGLYRRRATTAVILPIDLAAPLG